MMKKLNFGCGKNYLKGFVNLDISKNVKADVYANAEDGLKMFKNNSFDYIYARHVMEHIHHEKFGFVLRELIRILKPRGILDIWCPYFACGITWRETDHFVPISYFTIKSDDKFSVKTKFNFFRTSFGHKIFGEFEPIIKIINPLLSLFPNLFPLIYERFFCWIYPCEEVYFKITKN